MRKVATILLVISFIGAAYVAGGHPPMRLLLGQVGVGASVPPNPYNTLAEQLTDWQGELSVREKQLAERETIVEESTQELNKLLAVAVIIIALLLGINFYLDWHRRRGCRRSLHYPRR